MNKIVRFIIAIFLFTSLFALHFMDGGAVVSAQGAKAQWEAVIALSPDQVQYAQDTSAEMSASFQAKGVTASIDDGSLKLSGAQGLEQMRSAFFDDSAQWVDFLGGPVELTLILPAGTASVTLRMESRLTTGYAWEVLDAKNYAQNGESAFEMRYRGLGAPAIQTIQLQSTDAGDGTVSLIYRRAFEKDTPIHARATLWLTEFSGAIELSDPTPTEPAAAESNPGAETANPYAELLPKALPASYDARTLDIVPAVRDQKSCGSCWAFGTVGVMEIAVKKGGGPLTDLSEQFIVSCNKDGWGCNGGLTSSKYHYNTLGKSQTAIGAVLESDKPYTSTKGTCAIAYAHPYKASSWQFVTGSERNMPTNAQIKNAIITYGAVTTRVCADSGWDSYTGGVYNPTSNQCSGSINHQIVLVGWNDATGSWILRNSWGSSWGENGYMRIKYNPTGTTSRVGEGASWVKYTGSAPTVSRPISPAGDTTATKPRYIWSRVSAASSYKLQVYDIAAAANVVNMTVSSSYCSIATNRCAYTPSTALTLNKSYKWRIAAGSGAYSVYKAFKVAPAASGFNSQFNGSTPNWVKRPGGAWANTSTAYYTNGSANLFSSASYNRTFGNFTYQARIKRASAAGYSTGLVVRGTSVFDNENDWKTAYEFIYNNNGSFTVWKGVGGNWTRLKPWTTSAAIVKNNWNTLKVIANGSQFRFYINGTLVWNGSDASLKTGQVGLWMYSVGKMEVDWATLSASVAYQSAEQVEEGQVELTEQPDRFGNPLP